VEPDAKMTEITSFEDLDVWKACRELRRTVFKLTKTFPQEERFRLGDQMIGAAISSTANIAEGYGRYHYQENIQFCRQSRGSLYEILDHLTSALDLEYIDEAAFTKYRLSILGAIKLLNGYIRMLTRHKSIDH
jgi:four helix bundle protein